MVFGTTDRGIEALRAHECDMLISIGLLQNTLFAALRTEELGNEGKIKCNYLIEKVV